jgi:hypothetical protein
MDIMFFLVAVVIGAVIAVVLAINMRMSSEVARLRSEVAELDRARSEIAGMLGEAREAIGAADRDMKNMRTEFRAEIDQRLKNAAGGQG